MRLSEAYLFGLSIIFFYTILDCILVQVYCTEHDPIYLIQAEKFCFTIVKIEIYQQNYLTKMKVINKLRNFGWFLMIK